MKKVSIILMSLFFSILIYVSPIKAAPCNTVSKTPSEGKFTQKCIHNILKNYQKHHSNGYFVIEISSHESIYLQGYRASDSSYVFEAVGPKYSKKATPKVERLLTTLGWTMPGKSGNYERTIKLDQILNQDTSALVYQTLKQYNTDQENKETSYWMSDF